MVRCRFSEFGCRGPGLPSWRLHRRDGRSQQQSPRVRRPGNPSPGVRRHAALSRACRWIASAAALGQQRVRAGAGESGAQAGKVQRARGGQDPGRTTAATVVVGRPRTISARRDRRRDRVRGRSRAPTTPRARCSRPECAAAGRQVARCHSIRRCSLGCPEARVGRRHAESAKRDAINDAGHVRHPDIGMRRRIEQQAPK